LSSVKPTFLYTSLVIYRLLATLVVMLHFGFVVFVILGGLLVFRWRIVAWVHLPAAIWGALIEFADWICPLTPIENWLRRRAGLAGYEGGFIENYLLRTLYPDGLTRETQWTIGIIVIVVNVAVYWFAFRKH